jgi:hypothetical protein
MLPMLTSQKLLYILPDVAYVTELLPTKKEHTFAIHVFRQINGEFLDDNEFITENLEKLVSKIDPAEYHLILPDFLFTNTIVEVPDTSETKVKAHMTDKLLPSLEISENNYAVETFTLTQHQGKSKVQLSALEKSVVAQFAQVAKEKDITIVGISPLSWTIKSVVSLEPSVSVIQMGSMLYVAMHYIGLDQASQAKVEELDSIAETIKTLKGAEPSIQTVYLLTNELVADQLKELASNTVPMQQLATFKEEETQMPSYVKQIIEAGMKTLDITEYHTPSFAIPKEGEVTLPTPTKASSATESVKDKDVAELPELPLPTREAAAVVTTGAATTSAATTAATTAAATPAIITPVVIGAETAPTSKVSEPTSEDKNEDTKAVVAAGPAVIKADSKEEDSDKEEVTDNKEEKAEEKEEKAVVVTPTVAPPAVPEAPISLTQFAPKTEASSPEKTTPVVSLTPPTSVVSAGEDSKKESSMPEMTSAPAPVIKNPHNGGKVLQMVFVTAAVFFATVGIGVGIGLAVLSLNNRSNSEPVSPVSPTPTSTVAPVAAPPSPTPATASPSATVNKKATKLLVVNATTIAGHAGKTKKALETAGYGTVTAGNAKGTYAEKGTFVLMKTQDTALIAELEAASGLKLTFQPGYETEDPAGTNTAVIVLAE